VDRIYVVEGSVAHRIGFRTDDRVVEVNGRELERFDDLLGLRSLVADRATFVVVRDGSQTTLTAPKDLVTQLSRGSGTGVFGAGIYAYPYVELAEVAGDAPAGKAGLLAGDRVVSIDGREVFVLEELTALIQQSKGKTVELLIRRTTDICSTIRTRTSTGRLDLASPSSKVSVRPGSRPWSPCGVSRRF
jgi:regulator of sigma E protease